jgi:hypothetical protein
LVKKNPDMIELYSPGSEAELALIKSIFDAEHIHYYVRNDHFGSLEVGPLPIRFFNEKMIFVWDDQLGIAKELLKDFLKKTESKVGKFKDEYSFLDKVRMFLEFLLFNWVMRGSKRHKK